MSQSCLSFLSFILRKKKDIRLYKFGRGDEPKGLGNAVKVRFKKRLFALFHCVSLCKAFIKAL
jgi:hypothetical protein